MQHLTRAMSFDHTITQKYIDQLSYKIIGAAIEVHKNVGPGLLESVYHRFLKQELFLRGIDHQTELLVPVLYKGINLETQLRCDFFVNRLIVVEIKSVEFLAPVFEAQILTYMKLLKAPKGILVNFNSVNLFKEGQQTYVNELYRELPFG